MLKDIVTVKPLTNYQLVLCFEDGMEGVVDISQLIQFSGIFAPLHNQVYFAQAQIHPELGTVIWQNGADLDPDVLYAVVANSPSQTIPVLRSLHKGSKPSGYHSTVCKRRYSEAEPLYGRSPGCD